MQFGLGCIARALVTSAFFGLYVDLASTAFANLIATVSVAMNCPQPSAVS